MKFSFNHIINNLKHIFLHFQCIIYIINKKLSENPTYIGGDVHVLFTYRLT